MCNLEFEQLLGRMLLRSYAAPNGCLIWLGGSSRYGRIWWQGENRDIHRLIYKIFTGREPEVVRHTCDNTLCWNFLHLVEGSQNDNIQDKVSKGRQAFGERHGCARLTEEQVLEIRASRSTEGRLAMQYNVSCPTIGRIRRYETWKHLMEKNHG